jgi:hypothetical protein
LIDRQENLEVIYLRLASTDSSLRRRSRNILGVKDKNDCYKNRITLNYETPRRTILDSTGGGRLSGYMGKKRLDTNR